MHIDLIFVIYVQIASLDMMNQYEIDKSNLSTVVEYMAVNRRTLVVNVAFGIYFAIGSTVLPWIAYYVANWRFFAYVTAIPMMNVFITPWILPESAR